MLADKIVPLGSNPAVIRIGRIGHRRRISRHHQRVLRREHLQQRSNDDDGSADGISDFAKEEWTITVCFGRKPSAATSVTRESSVLIRDML